MTLLPDSDGRYRCDICGRRFPLTAEKAAGNVYHRCTVGPLDCPHRGATLREVPCKLCGGHERMVPIFACSIYGECALSRTKSGSVGEVRQCLTCDDLPANAERNAK